MNSGIFSKSFRNILKPFQAAKRKQKRNNNFYNTSVHLAVQGAADFANAGRQCAAGGNGLNGATHDQWGCLKLLLALAEVQSRIDFPDVVGRTALHLAASNRLQPTSHIWHQRAGHSRIWRAAVC